MEKRKPRVEITKVGHEQSQILIVDNAISNLEPLVHDACSGSGFKPSTAMYPGINAMALKRNVEPIFGFLRRLIFDHYDTPAGHELVLTNVFYGLVSKTPELLNPYQCFPHFDDTNTHGFAALLYINSGNFGGTSFYRHNPTSLERVTPDREDEFYRHLQECVSSEFSKNYYDGDAGGDFERIVQVQHRENRLVLYPSNLLHSGDIVSAEDISESPAAGRLTLNFFIKSLVTAV